MSKLSGKQRRLAFERNSIRRMPLIETATVSAGREWSSENLNKRLDAEVGREMEVHELRLYERDVRRYQVRGTPSVGC